MDSILKYFPDLTERQKEQFARLGELYPEWNAKINVISRKDIENLYVNHILHSLSIARFFGNLAPNTSLIDLGTGGGFPGIPLAIMYPEASFLLIDRIGKKLTVAGSIAEEIGLNNVALQHGDIGECHRRFDYVVSRAVMPLDRLVKLSRRNVKSMPDDVTQANRYTPGIVCLKGGDLSEESEGVNLPVIEYQLTEYFTEPFFETKKLVYVPVAKL
jgi:16S rRNA (guanine527-N7)-methyltransferase